MNRNKIAIPVLILLLLVMQASAVSVTWWKIGSDKSWSMDQSMWIEKKTSHTFWAQQWSWTGTNNPAYMGLQTDGLFFNGLPSGELAIFSAWNATAASGYNCGKFTGEGEGYSCRIPFKIQNNTIYTFRIWRLNTDSQGQWWGAWIYDGTNGNGQSAFIGTIRINSTDIGIGSPIIDWTETPTSGCNPTTKSIADWAKPAFDYIGSGRLWDDSGYLYNSGSGKVDNGCNNGIIRPRNLVITPYGI